MIFGVTSGDDRLRFFVIEGDQCGLNGIATNGHQIAPDTEGVHVPYAERALDKRHLNHTCRDERDERARSSYCSDLLNRLA